MKPILIHWSSEDLQFFKSVLLTLWGHTHHFLYQLRIDFTYLDQSTRMATWNGQYIICILYWMASGHVILYPWKLQSSWKIIPSWWRRVSIHQNGGRQATLYGRGSNMTAYAGISTSCYKMYCDHWLWPTSTKGLREATTFLTSSLQSDHSLFVVCVLG